MRAHLGPNHVTLSAHERGKQSRGLPEISLPMPHHLRISRRRDLEQGKQGNLLPLAHKLPRDFKRDDSAVTVPAQKIGTLRTHGTDGSAETLGVFLYRVHSPVLKRPRVSNNQERLIVAQSLRQIQKIVRV